MSIVTKNEYWENAEMREAWSGVRLAYARVAAVNADGEPALVFAGEETPSPKRYLRVASYTPQAGDRVMLINDIIVGGWKPNA